MIPRIALPIGLSRLSRFTRLWRASDLRSRRLESRYYLDFPLLPDAFYFLPALFLKTEDWQLF